MSIDVQHAKHADLHDAQAIAKEFPDHVSVPSLDSLASLAIGECVKVGTGEHGKGSEAFWVELSSVGPLHMLGVIVNELRFTAVHGLSAGDVILVSRENVYAISE